MKDIRVYYAHSKNIYDTDQERQERKWLIKHYKVVVDPNLDLGELGDIQLYLKVINTCDIVIFSEYKKFVSKGTYTEVCHAQSNGIPVKVIRHRVGCMYLKDIRFLRVHDFNDWRFKYAETVLK